MIEVAGDTFEAVGGAAAALYTTYLSARSGRSAAETLASRFQQQQNRAAGQILALGFPLPPDQPLDPVEDIPIPTPLVAQRLDRVSRELRLVPGDSADQPG